MVLVGLWNRIVATSLHQEPTPETLPTVDPPSHLRIRRAQVYDVFGLQYRMALSTRPEKYMGSLELWAKAEASLEDALNASGQQWEVPCLMTMRPIGLPDWCGTQCGTRHSQPVREPDAPGGCRRRRLLAVTWDQMHMSARPSSAPLYAKLQAAFAAPW